MGSSRTETLVHIYIGGELESLKREPAWAEGNQEKAVNGWTHITFRTRSFGRAEGERSVWGGGLTTEGRIEHTPSIGTPIGGSSI